MHNINCLVLVLAAVSRLYGLKDVDLTIGGIFPMSGSWAGGMACKPAVQLALDMVNNQTKILSHYRLAMQYNDSQVFIYYLPIGSGFSLYFLHSSLF